MARARTGMFAFGPTGNFLAGASVTLVNRFTQANAVVFSTEAGAGQLAQPLTSDARGRVPGWLDRGAYTATFTFPGYTGWAEDFEVVPGGDKTIDSAWLADSVLVARHIADGLITLAKLAGDVLPSGLIVPWGGMAAPTGWLLCDGSFVSKTGAYANLYALVGNAFNGGVDPGNGTFKLPDLRGRTVHGADNFGVGAGARLPNVPAAAKLLGGVGGEDYHTIAIAELPSHNHGGATGGQSADHSHSGTTGAADRSLDHLHVPQTPFETQYQYGNGSFTGMATVGGGIGWWSSDGRTGAMDRSIDHLHGFSTGGTSVNHTHAITAQGGGGVMNIMQPFQMATWLVKV